MVRRLSPFFLPLGVVVCLPLLVPSLCTGSAPVLGARGYLSNGTDFLAPDPTFKSLNFDDIQFDQIGLGFTAAGDIVIPEDGLYMVCGQVAVTTDAPGAHTTGRIRVNGVEEDRFLITQQPSELQSADFGALLTLSTGDTVSVELIPDHLDGGILNGNTSALDVVRFATGASPAARGARAYLANASAFLTNDSTYTNLDFDDVQFDQIGLTHLPGGEIVVPSDGLYWVSGQFDLQNTGAQPGYVTCRMTVNGAIEDLVLGADRPGVQLQTLDFGAIFDLSVGDTLAIRAQPYLVAAMDEGVFSALDIVHFSTLGETPVGRGTRSFLTNGADFSGGGNFINMVYDDLQFDQSGASFLPTGQIVIADDGLYSVSGQFDVKTVFAGPTGIRVNLHVNLTSVDVIRVVHEPSIWQTVEFNAVLLLTAGDSLRVRMRPNEVEQVDDGAWSALDLIRFADATAVGVADLGVPPAANSLTLRAHPNPFRGSTRLDFELSVASETHVGIYDVSGRHVRTLLRATVPAGHRHLTWDGRDAAGEPVASGVYFGRVVAAGAVGRERVVVLR